MRSLRQRGDHWKFIPRPATWCGRFWEGLVALTRKAMRKTLGRISITIMELQTHVVEIEAALKDRPLQHVSIDICDEETLTHSHLIFGRVTSLPFDWGIPSDDVIEPSYGDGINIRRRVKLHAQLLQRFWNRWRNEYLTSLPSDDWE